MKRILFSLFLTGLSFSLHAQSLDITQVQPLNGTPGATITIYGTGFDASNTDNTVSFNPVGGGTGTTATVSSATTTQLTVTVPDITGGNYTLSVERYSDDVISIISTDIELFAVTTGGGDFGTVGSSEHIVSTAADGAQSVYAGDVDGDGDLDLISASFSDNKIAWYEHDGSDDPSFTERVVSTTADAAQSIFAGDVDGDGDLDLMSASLNDDKITWYENDGAANPSFTERVVSTNADEARSVFAGDVDGDGDLDLMSASSGDDKIAWYENDGAADPSFTERVVSTTADGAFSVFSGDVDGDGDLDLISASGLDDKIAWYEHDGGADPSFTERVVSTTADFAISVYAGDVDGDGDLDLISASSTDDTIAWYEHDGGADPSFNKRVVSTTANAAQSIFAGDVDGDGDLDLISASSTDHKIAWYENDGAADPFFTERVVSTGADFARNVFAADVDADGDLDLLSASSSDHKIAWYENADPPFAITQIQTTNGTPGTSLTIYGAGFNAIATDNTVTFSPAGGGAGTTATVTSGTSTQLTVTVPPVTGGNYTLSVQRARDSATDTAIELFAVTTFGGNFGAVGSSEHIVSTAADGAHSVFAADVDGDGDLDLLSASIFDDKIAWYENDGAADPSFTERVVSTTADGARNVFAANVDGDGDLDLISSYTSFVTDHKIVWYENDGAADPSFTERIASTPAGATRSVHAGDVDGDGDLDLLSSYSSFIDHEIVWYENDGAADPSFTERVVSTTADAVNSVFAGDVDGDGDLDLMSASFNDDKIAWYENDGAADPAFTERVVSTNANAANSVFAGDVDGDGDLDLMSASLDDGTIAWYEHNGGIDPSFTKRAISTTGNGTRSVFAGDVDGDGDLDLMSASDGDDTIAWYKNRSSLSIPGRSLTFDGDGDFVQVPQDNALDLSNQSFTIEFWAKRTSIDDIHFALSLGSTASPNQLLHVGFRATNAFSFAFFDNDLTTVATYTDNDWHHWTVTFDQTTNARAIYRDGIQVASDIASAAFQGTGDLLIGKASFGRDFPGTIDEVRIWDVVRTEDQIRQNMFQDLAGDEAGLVAYFPFNEENGSEATDLTSNGFCGSFSGDVAMSTDTHPYGTFITGDEGWRMMTAPVGGTSYGALLEPLWTQGFTGADANGGDDPNVLIWDEVTQSFSAIANATDVPAAGQGFIVYVFDDDDFDGTPEGFPKTVLTDNTQNEGNTTPTITYNDTGTPADDGWNLVGNPYGATIDWDAASGWTRTNLDATFYVWDHSAGGGAGAYLSWNGATGTLDDGLIAPWQGFWVQANAAAPTLEFTDEVRDAGGVFLKQHKEPVPQIRFSLEECRVERCTTASADIGPALHSKAIVMFATEAKAGKDHLDGWKLKSLSDNYLNLYTTGTGGEAFDINALPSELGSPLEVTLNFIGSDLDGRYMLNWNPEGLSQLPSGVSVTLTDLYTDKQWDLSQPGQYSFEVAKTNEKTITQPSLGRDNSSKAGSGMDQPYLRVVPTVLQAKASNPRFVLTIQPKASENNPLAGIPATVELAQNYPNPFNPETVIRYGVPEQAQVNLEVYDVLGRRVATLLDNQQRAPGRYQLSFDASRFASGLYIYRLKVGQNIITKKMTLIK